MTESAAYGVNGTVLCGSPFSGLYPQRSAAAPDTTSQCMRCRQSCGSYFDHTCPQCTAVMCALCLEDFRFIVDGYRCLVCGEEKANQDAMRRELWYLGTYRKTQFALTSVSASISGLFSWSGASQSQASSVSRCGLRAEHDASMQSGYSTEAGSGYWQPPPSAAPAGRSEMLPPRGNASAAGPSSARDREAMPEYRTRPPAGWEEAQAAQSVEKWAQGPPPEPPRSGPPPEPPRPANHPPGSPRDRCEQAPRLFGPPPVLPVSPLRSSPLDTSGRDGRGMAVGGGGARRRSQTPDNVVRRRS